MAKFAASAAKLRYAMDGENADEKALKRYIQKIVNEEWKNLNCKKGIIYVGWRACTGSSDSVYFILGMDTFYSRVPVHTLHCSTGCIASPAHM